MSAIANKETSMPTNVYKAYKTTSLEITQHLMDSLEEEEDWYKEKVAKLCEISEKKKAETEKIAKVCQAYRATASQITQHLVDSLEEEEDWYKEKVAKLCEISEKKKSESTNKNS